MYQLTNIIKQHAQIANSGNVNGRRGVVTSFNPTTWKVEVTFYPVGKAGTASIALGSPCVGNGWGAYFWPSVGAQVIVFYENGSNLSPVGLTQIFDQEINRPLQGIQQGEMWLVHQSGSKISFNQDGSITISANTALNLDAQNININAQTAISLTAPNVTVSSEGGTPQPLLNADNQPTTILQAE